MLLAVCIMSCSIIYFYRNDKYFYFRYVGYSYITCAWFAFPFEALEVFTLFLLRVASSKYIQVLAINNFIVLDKLFPTITKNFY